MNHSVLKLCLVTHRSDNNLEAYLDFVLQAVEGGVTLVQLRDKTNTASEIKACALALKNLLTPLNIPLIINDNLELAKEVDAEGVHLGPSDASPLKARALLGPDKIIGFSVETEAQLEFANQLDCINYIAASAVFPTNTKKDCITYWGLDGLSTLAKKSKHPVVAIGGINKNNAQQVMQHGAKGVAVVSAIHDHEHPKDSAAELIQAIHSGNNHYVPSY